MGNKSIIVVGAVVLLAIVSCPISWFIGRRKSPVPLIITENEFVHLDTSGDSNADLLSFYETYLGKEGSFGLRQIRHTLEGDTILLYLLVRNGKVTLVLDFTQSAHSIRRFLVEHPRRIVLGYRNADAEFIDDPTDGDTTGIVLKVVREKGGEVLVY